MAEPKPLPPVLTDPLFLTSGLGGNDLLPAITPVMSPITGVQLSGLPLPAGSGQIHSKAETTSQTRNRNYNVTMGNPMMIGSVFTPEQYARVGREMLTFAENKIENKLIGTIKNIPKNIIKGVVMKQKFTPFSAGTTGVYIDAVKHIINGTLTGETALSLGGKVVKSAVGSAIWGAVATPNTIGSASDMNSDAFKEWAKGMAEKEAEHMAKVKMIDEEYGKKMKGKYAGVEMLMETPMWKRDTSAQFTPEERKLQNYEEIIAERFRRVEAASRERARLENGFYNDKGDFMSAHFIRNSQ